MKPYSLGQLLVVSYGLLTENQPHKVSKMAMESKTGLYIQPLTMADFILRLPFNSETQAENEFDQQAMSILQYVPWFKTKSKGYPLTIRSMLSGLSTDPLQLRNRTAGNQPSEHCQAAIVAAIKIPRVSF